MCRSFCILIRIDIYKFFMNTALTFFHSVYSIINKGGFPVENKKTDRRIKYTKSVLRQSLLELMRETDISKITVTDICAKADINRGTFYKYYSGPRELLLSIDDELYSSIKNAISGQFPDGKKRAFPDSGVILQIISCIYENSDICKILLGEFGDMEFLSRIIFIAQRQCEDDWSETAAAGSKNLPAYMYSYTAGGCLSLLRSWVTGGMEESPQEIASIIDNIVTHGLYAYIK